MLEIACFNSRSAIAAAKAGADRIELCADYAAGGVTPARESLQDTKQEVDIPVNVMIRPRPGDFNYSPGEYQQMRSDIQMLKEEADALVFGILDKDGRVHVNRNRALVQEAAPLQCTFHRAFDQVPDLFDAAELIIECGFSSILTSGGQADAIAGASIVAELQKKYGNKISFILGGGIRSTNIEALRNRTDLEWYHSAAIVAPGELVDEDEVRKLRAILNESQLR
ncbi:hypothetical protein EJ04DRAFT_310895 [Polyplosphaeria fusca]|uniref:Copper homeostasis protein cutC homolog n=1 Tax=Polyplosphaeria fusca TaxID=682080 RepID=A0A9P4R934_9PLEO|nr:hypothetical protein EJ04DRAFT_310895 [Polyplosphaeria fusca]